MYGTIPAASDADVPVGRVAEREPEGRSRGRRILGLALTAGAVGALAASRSSVKQSDEVFKTETSLSSTITAAAPSSILDFATHNSYTNPDTGGKTVGSQYPWVTDATKLVEPHRTTTLYVSSYLMSDTEADNQQYTYEWTIGEHTNKYTGDTVEHTFKGTGDFTISIQQLNGAGDVVGEHEGSVTSKYVRREIRSLSDEDRNAYLTAHEKLLTLSDEEGKDEFGDRFSSLNDLAREHNKQAGAVDCDHMHDGLGFLGLHSSLTSRYEMSLQAVDPTVAVPYWDYTMDTADPMGSPVFDPDWFGAVPATDSKAHYIEEGRWEKMPVAVDENFDGTHNAYGFLRAPWNTNNSPYVSRSSQMLGLDYSEFPGCYEHFHALEHNTWQDFAWYIPYDGHSPVHKSIGGNYDADWATILLDQNNYDPDSYKQKWLLAQKEMWRAGVLECPEYCSMDTPTSECKCTCPNLKEDIEELGGSINSFLLQWIHPKPVTNMDGDDLSQVFVDLLCNNYPELTPKIGDMLSSSSAFDIAFWPIHPTLERVTLWKRINGFEDESWAADDDAYITGEACYGHGADDVVPWNFWLDDVDGEFHSFTNQEMWDLIDPNQPNLPYIYDSFDWEHCESEGFTRDLLANTTTVESQLAEPAMDAWFDSDGLFQR